MDESKMYDIIIIYLSSFNEIMTDFAIKKSNSKFQNMLAYVYI